jgi:hypothetical protein
VHDGDAGVTRCDFYQCGGDMKPEIFVQMLNSAKTYGDGPFTSLAQANCFHARYEDSKSTNPRFYFASPSGLIILSATYFHAGFFTNGTIGAGGVANIASIASFNWAHFTKYDLVVYIPARSTSFLSS